MATKPIMKVPSLNHQNVLRVCVAVVAAATATSAQLNFDCHSNGTSASATTACFFMPPEHSPRSWAEAEAACREYGGNLASILTKEEEQIVYDLFEDGDPSAASHGVWIGAADTEELLPGAVEGTFLWSSGVAADVYQNWGPNKPNSDDSADCAAMFRELGGTGWGVGRCDLELSFVCTVREKPDKDLAFASVSAELEQADLKLETKRDQLTALDRELRTKSDELAAVTQELKSKSDELAALKKTHDNVLLYFSVVALAANGVDDTCGRSLTACYNNANSPWPYGAKYAEHCVDQLRHCLTDFQTSVQNLVRAV